MIDANFVIKQQPTVASLEKRLETLARENPIAGMGMPEEYFETLRQYQHEKAKLNELLDKRNATLDELLEAVEQLKQRAEPELRPLTLYEVKNRCKIPLAEALFLEFKRGWKSYRFWPRKPTPEQMAAEKWEE